MFTETFFGFMLFFGIVAVITAIYWFIFDYLFK